MQFQTMTDKLKTGTHYCKGLKEVKSKCKLKRCYHIHHITAITSPSSQPLRCSHHIAVVTSQLSHRCHHIALVTPLSSYRSCHTAVITLPSSHQSSCSESNSKRILKYQQTLEPGADPTAHSKLSKALTGFQGEVFYASLRKSYIQHDQTVFFRETERSALDGAEKEQKSIYNMSNLQSHTKI